MKQINKWIANEWVLIFFAGITVVIFSIEREWAASGWTFIAGLMTFNFRSMRIRKEIIEKQFQEYIKVTKNAKH